MPESVLQHPALATAPTYAFKVLAVLLVGKSKDRNGLMMCSESYAAKYGITAKITVHRALQLLVDRGLIERTRRVQAFRKAATLWAVTWWPICYREGEPLPTSEPAPHTYRSWTGITSTTEVETDNASHPLRRLLTSTTEVETPTHHIHSEVQGASHHIPYGGHSKILGLGAALADARLADCIAVARSTPGIVAADLAKRVRCDESIAHRALQKLQAESVA
jgi:hypothetical protein